WAPKTFYGPGWSIATPTRHSEKPPRLRGGGVTAPRRPAMSELVSLYEASRKRAFEDATAKARQLAGRLAA
ncbi:hypothetical protein ACFV87_53515, partial [Streptomyces mirabilis]